MSILLRTMMARMATRIIYEGVIASGDLHIATKDGEAMFFHDSIDFSSYAGTDGGYTPYRLVFTDSAGKNAVAYGGAAGGGEALGAELVPSPDMSADFWDYKGVNWSYDAINDKFVNAGGGDLMEDFGMAVGEMYKAVPDLSDYVGGLLAFINYNAQILVAGFSGDGTHTKIFTVATTSFAGKLYLRAVGPSSDFSLTDLSLKKYTDVPATGLHLMSAKNGTTRNMTSVETGFDPNAIVGVKIYG